MESGGCLLMWFLPVAGLSNMGQKDPGVLQRVLGVFCARFPPQEANILIEAK